MGWTEYRAKYFHEDGQINRKKECDAYFLEGLNAGHYAIVKSTIKGSVYYGAIMPLKRVQCDERGEMIKDAHGWYVYENVPESEREVFGVVIKTYVRDKTNFGYKIISETMGPVEQNCPISILNELTSTTNQYASEWRKACMRNAAKPSPSKLPIGTEIQFEYNGKTVTLRKSAPRYQFKTPFWMNDADCTYFSKKRLPKDFTIVNLPTT